MAGGPVIQVKDLNFLFCTILQSHLQKNFKISNLSNLKVRKLKKNTHRIVEYNMAFTDFKRKKAEICKFCGSVGRINLQFRNLSLWKPDF